MPAQGTKYRVVLVVSVFTVVAAVLLGPAPANAASPDAPHGSQLVGKVADGYIVRFAPGTSEQSARDAALHSPPGSFPSIRRHFHFHSFRILL